MLFLIYIFVVSKLHLGLSVNSRLWLYGWPPRRAVLTGVGQPHTLIKYFGINVYLYVGVQRSSLAAEAARRIHCLIRTPA